MNSRACSSSDFGASVREVTAGPAWSDRWAAAWLSLLAPGAGHLLAGSPWGFVWMFAAGALAAGAARLAHPWNAESLFLFPILLVCGCAAARGALRLHLPAPPWPRAGVTEERLACRRRGRRVELTLQLDSPLPAEAMWRRIADLPRFLTLDPFHERVDMVPRRAAAGTTLILWHSAFGFRFPRFGRILQWREGEGYTFSDLSRRGPRHGFPHVFQISVEQRGEGSRLRIRARGRWTSFLPPAVMGMLWLRWVCREHLRILRNTL